MCFPQWNPAYLARRLSKPISVNLNRIWLLINQAKWRIFIVDTIRDEPMIIKIQKLCNSLALRIPKTFAIGAKMVLDLAVEMPLIEDTHLMYSFRMT
jgi:hypothetical protein